MIAGADILSRPSNHTVLVPVNFLEHYRFRLSPPDEQSGVGQGGGRPNDVYQQGQGQGEGGAAGQAGAGGSGTGELRLLDRTSVGRGERGSVVVDVWSGRD